MPISVVYLPVIGVSNELVSHEDDYYQSLIGVIILIVKLGRVNINVEASLMASCMTIPSHGHLDQLFHILGYLKKKHNSEVSFYSSRPDIDEV